MNLFRWFKKEAAQPPVYEERKPMKPVTPPKPSFSKEEERLRHRLTKDITPAERKQLEQMLHKLRMNRRQP